MARPGAMRTNNMQGYIRLLEESAERLRSMEELLNAQVRLKLQERARMHEEELAYVRGSGADSGFVVIKDVELLGHFAKGERISLAPPPGYAIGTEQIYYIYLGNYTEPGVVPDPRTFVESIITDSLGYYSDSFANELYIPEGHGLYIRNPVPQGINVNVTLQIRRYRTHTNPLSQEEAYALAEGFSSYTFNDEEDIQHGEDRQIVHSSDDEEIDTERTEPIIDERPQPHFAGGMTNLDSLPMHGEEDLL